MATQEARHLRGTGKYILLTARRPFESNEVMDDVLLAS